MPLPLLTAVTSTRSTVLEQVDLDLLADFEAAHIVEPQLDHRRPGSTPAFWKCPALGFDRLRAVRPAEGHLHGVVAVVLHGLHLHDPQGDLDHGHGHDTAVVAHTWVMPTLLADDRFRCHCQRPFSPAVVRANAPHGQARRSVDSIGLRVPAIRLRGRAGADVGCCVVRTGGDEPEGSDARRDEVSGESARTLRRPAEKPSSCSRRAVSTTWRTTVSTRLSARSSRPSLTSVELRAQ